jgi:hypothetical protein
MGMQVRRWLPNRKLILVADSSYAALELLHSLFEPAKTSLHSDAVAFGRGPTQVEITKYCDSVPLWYTSRSLALGVNPRPLMANSRHAPYCVQTSSLPHYNSYNGLSCAGNSKSLSRKYALTWALRHNANGLIKPSPGQLLF